MSFISVSLREARHGLLKMETVPGNRGVSCFYTTSPFMPSGHHPTFPQLTSATPCARKAGARAAWTCRTCGRGPGPGKDLQLRPPHSGPPSGAQSPSKRPIISGRSGPSPRRRTLRCPRHCSDHQAQTPPPCTFISPFASQRPSQPLSICFRVFFFLSVSLNLLLFRREHTNFCSLMVAADL